MAVALIALFVALSGTAVAAGIVPLAKRALVADNAMKLQGRTSMQLLAHENQPAKRALVAENAMKLEGQKTTDIAALPGPASTAAGLVAIKTAPWSLNPGSDVTFTVTCDAGQKALAGGYSDAGGWTAPYQTMPTADGGGWAVELFLSRYAPAAQSGTVYAVCLK